MVPNDIVSSLIAVQMGGTGGGGTYLGLITLEEMDKLPVLASIEYGEYRTDFKVYKADSLNAVGSGYKTNGYYNVNVFKKLAILCRVIYKNGTAVYGTYSYNYLNLADAFSYNYFFDSGKLDMYYSKTYIVNSVTCDKSTIYLSGPAQIKVTTNYTEKHTYYDNGKITDEYEQEASYTDYQYVIGNYYGNPSSQFSATNLSDTEIISELCEAEKAFYETYST